MIKRKKVVEEVFQIIRRGKPVMIYKTKWRHQGGKQLVSVGPMIRAVGPSGYSLITKQNETFTSSAWDAAKDFVAFVGRDLAMEACNRARAKYEIYRK